MTTGIMSSEPGKGERHGRYSSSLAPPSLPEDVFLLGRGLVLLCVQQQRGGSSGRGSGGDCGCPTGQSVPSKSPPPAGWDETWQIPQTRQETEERGNKVIHGKGETRNVDLWRRMLENWEEEGPVETGEARGDGTKLGIVSRSNIETPAATGALTASCLMASAPVNPPPPHPKLRLHWVWVPPRCSSHMGSTLAQSRGTAGVLEF